MKNKYVYWHEDDVSFLRNNYGVLGIKEIANELNKSVSSITHKAHKLGICRLPTFSKCKQCGKDFQVSPRTITRGGAKFCSRQCQKEHRFIDESKARILFNQWEKSRQPIDVFCKNLKTNHCRIRSAFKKYFPDEYEMHIEEKKKINVSYRKGRKFEYRVRNYLIDMGEYFVLRSPRSGGPADLVAVKMGSLLFVQCKLWGCITKKDKAELITLSNNVGAVPVLAYKNISNDVILRNLNNEEYIVMAV